MLSQTERHGCGNPIHQRGHARQPPNGEKEKRHNEFHCDAQKARGFAYRFLPAAVFATSACFLA